MLSHIPLSDSMSSVVEELEEPPSFSSHTEFNLDSAVLASELQTLCAAVGTLAQILSNTSVAIVLMLSHTPLSDSMSSVVEELEEPPIFSSHTEFNLDSAASTTCVQMVPAPETFSSSAVQSLSNTSLAMELMLSHIPLSVSISSVVEELEEPPNFSSHTEFNLDSAVLASELQTLCAAVGTLAQILSNTSVAIVLMLSHTPLSDSMSSVVEELEEPPSFSSHREFNLVSAASTTCVQMVPAPETFASSAEQSLSNTSVAMELMLSHIPLSVSMSSVVEELEEPPIFSSHTEFNLDSAVLASELQMLCAAVGTLAQILSNTSVAIVLMLSHTPLSDSSSSESVDSSCKMPLVCPAATMSSEAVELEEPPSFSSHTEFNLVSAASTTCVQMVPAPETFA